MWFWVGLIFSLAWGISRELFDYRRGFNPPPWVEIVKAVEDLAPFRVGLALPLFGAVIAFSIAMLVIIVVGFFALSRSLGGSPVSHITPGMELTFLPFKTALTALQMTQIVTACAKADQEVGEERVHSVARIPVSSASIKRAILRSNRHRAFSRPFSHHNAVLRNHAAQVVGKIQQAEEGLYRDPNPALRALAALWLTIAERYIDGRVGELLSDDLSAVEPVKSRVQSALRAALAVVLTVGTVFFTASLDFRRPLRGTSSLVLLWLYYSSYTARGPLLNCAVDSVVSTVPSGQAKG